MKLTESAHVKDVLSFLRILVNPHDRLSWHRLLLQIEKIGPKTAESILNTLMEHENPFHALKFYPARLGFDHGLRRLSDAFESMRLPALSPAYVFELAMTYYQPILERIYYEDHPVRLRDLSRIHSLAAGYTDLRNFVDDTVLHPPQAAADQGIILIASTIHSAKGKEFDTVFIVGLAEYRFPSCGEGEQNYEEERRLFYVAATRARKHLFLTYPKMLMTPDRKFRSAAASPFLEEIDQNLYEILED